MKCLNTIQLKGNTYNCGKCRNCRINYTSSWTLRCLYELDDWDCASFITLTYSDEFLPKDKSLEPKALTLFWKRLRQNLEYEYGKDKKPIKYFACGEYGEKQKIYFSPKSIKPHGRPHYHAIVYGLDPYNDKDREILKDSWSFCESWFFDKSRGKMSGMLPVCREDISYVCGYVQKKLNGIYAEEEYGEAVRPFSRCSQGLGLNFAMKNKERLLNNGFTFLNGHKISIPRYFCEKFGIKKSELICDSNININDIEKTNKIIFDEFEKQMKMNGTWYPENLTMMSIRFERWYNDHRYSIARQVERDFLQKSKLRGNLL